MELCYKLNSTESRRQCYEQAIQSKLDEPKPWIGMYIAVASAVCGIAMAVDVFYGFKTKKLWFPCKYFSLNATSLTLLSVAMKLTMDLTSSKLDEAGIVAGYSSFVLMLNAMGNFMTSLASMDDNEIMLNLTALGILVITIVINECIFMVQTNKAIYFGLGQQFEDYVSVALLLLLIFLCTSAIIAPTTKRYVEIKFSEMHKMVLNERVHGAEFTAQELRVILKKYWIMAGTGNPQFVLARSVICVIPSVICLVVTFKMFEFMYFNRYYSRVDFLHSKSIYKWSFSWILIIQTVGSVIGNVASTFRLFVAARFRSSRAGRISFKVELKTETYWTQRLVDWRESPMPLSIRRFKIKKILHISKKVLLNICIIIQIMIVLTSKLTLIISSWFINVAFKFLHIVNKLRRYVFKFTSERRGHEPNAASTKELDFSPYVMLLEGELELPNRIIANISNEADKLVHVGKMRKPKNIIKLLQKSQNFNGVSNFDRKNITSLHFQEPRNCWSLSVVTLTSIAIALPNISSNILNTLFISVSEGLPFVSVIEKFFDTSGELVRLRKTADVIWVRLELDQDKDFHGNSINDQTYKQKLLELSTTAKKAVMDFKTSMTDSVMNNPLNWPTEVIAANSMYRVCESLLLIEIDGTGDQLNKKFFERVTIIISDILAACLTNLAHVIFSECHIISIEKRQESIRHALILMGESEEIIQCLEHHEWPNMVPDNAGDIEEWRAIIELDIENPVSTTDDRSLP